MSYTRTLTIRLPYAEAVERTREALAEQSFGILSEIDVKATFEKKLGAESAEALGDYVILGACNQGLASKALAAEPQLGALLPCNVMVRRGIEGDQSIIYTVDSQTLVQLSDAPQVREVADARLRAALTSLANADPITPESP